MKQKTKLISRLQKPFALATALGIFCICLAFVSGQFLNKSQAQITAINVQSQSNAIDVSFDPAQPQLNSQVKITASLKNGFNPAYQGFTANVYLCNGSSCTTSIASQDGTGRQASWTFGLSSVTGLKAGSNSLRVEMKYQNTGQSGGIQGYTQDVSLTLLPASSTGPAQLTLSTSRNVMGAGSITKEYGLTYNPGSTGRQPTSITYDCGNGAGEKTLASNAATVSCVYDFKPANFALKVTAKDSSGTIVQTTQTVTITGNEATQGLDATQPGGGPLVSFLTTLVKAIVGLIQEFVYNIFYYIVAPLIQAMLSIRTYTDTFAAVIYPGWEIVRNVCNILFVVALIAIGLGTLFRMESYQYKHLLVDLIIAALLVNFSLVIAQAILGVADTIQNQFLPNNVEVIRALARDLMGGFKSLNITDFSQSGLFSSTIQPLFSLAVSLGSFFVFAGIAVFLIVRIVMLWVLMMLSPFAYAMRVLPTTKSYSGMWWKEFIKYAFFTPILAFFLNMAAVINVTYNAEINSSNSIFAKIISDPALLGNSGVAQFVFRVAGNVVILVFLLLAIRVAEQSGAFGADVVAKAATGGLMAPFKVFGSEGVIGKYAGRKWNEFTTNKVKGTGREVSFLRGVGFAALNPSAFAKGMKKRQEELSHAASAKAEAAALEVAEQRFTSPRGLILGNKKIIPRVLAHEKHEEDDFAKGYMNMSRELVARTAHEVFGLPDNEEGRAAKRGIIKVALAKGYIDDIVMEAHNTKDGQKMVQKMIDNGWVKADDFKNGVADAKDELQYNNRTRRAMYKAMFGDGGHGHLKDHAAMRLITEEGEEEGMSTGHLEYMTDFYFDVNTGDYQAYDLDESSPDLTSAGDSIMAAGEIAKRDSRTQARIAWHALMSSDGKRFNHAVFAKIAKAFNENSGFMQERTANMLIAGTTKLGDLEPIIKDFKETGVLKIDQTSKDRIEKMLKTDENATRAVLQRFLNDRSGALTNKLLAGGILKTTSGNITFKASTSSSVSDKTVSALQNPESTVKVSLNSVESSRAVLKNYDSSATIPSFNSVVNDIQTNAQSQGAIITRAEAVKITGQYIQDFVAKKASKLDLVNTTDIMTPATNYSNVENILSPQQLGRFADILNDAVQQGAAQGSKFSTDSEKINQLKIAVEKTLRDNDTKKQLGGADLSSVLNADEFARNVFQKIK